MTMPKTTVSSLGRGVLRLKDKHKHTWRTRGQVYWLWRLWLEVIELSMSLVGLHRHTVDLELDQIATIAMNWRELRGEVRDG